MSGGGSGNQDAAHHIRDIVLDEQASIRRSPQIEHEQRVAIFDLLEENTFRPLDAEDGGPYVLHLGIEDNRLIFDVLGDDEKPLTKITLPTSSLKRIVKDYFMICESYFEAIKTASPSRIEAIDMGRRGLHNEGSQILMDRLDGQVEMDLPTARRLFTLICVLHIRA